MPHSSLLQSLPGHLMPTSSGLFPRNFKKTFPIATRGEGCWIIADDGRRFLDASGQAAVVSIGHGVPEIGRAMAGQSSQIAFAHTSQFHTTAAETLASRLLAMAPPNFRNGGRVYFTSGGSEATETAIKLARQFHLECGQKDRYRVLSRRQSYHGSTLAASDVSADGHRPESAAVIALTVIAPRVLPPKLSRQHSRGDDRQRKRRSPRSVRTTYLRMGTHCSLFLLSLPV